MSFKNEKKYKGEKGVRRDFFVINEHYKVLRGCFTFVLNRAELNFTLKKKLDFLVSPDDATLKASICKKCDLILLALLLEVFLSEATYVPYLPGLRGGEGGGLRRD